MGTLVHYVYDTLQDDTPELTESFSVVITDVQLVNESDRMGSPSNSPRIAAGQESTVINILENDDSRGTLHVVTTVRYLLVHYNMNWIAKKN